MDEPFSAVDEQTRRKFQEDLIRLREIESKTFILVTHSIEEAVYLSDRIVLLTPHPGRVADVIDLDIPRAGDPDAIRRSQTYLDLIDEIWAGLRKYVE
jgi:NitT/TauT family transport system ATP-binding protein